MTISMLHLGVWALFLITCAPPAAASGVIQYYLHQQFGVNELSMVQPARPPVEGSRTGFGLEVVYEYPITKNAGEDFAALGYVRGTSVVVNNTAASTTFFVNNVVHYDDGKKIKGTFVQQGEAAFSSGDSWEFAIVGGTGSFRNGYGYSIGRVYSITPSTSGGSNVVVTQYEVHLSYKD